MSEFKFQSKQYQDGYVKYHNELVGLIKKANIYDLTNTQFAKMFRDFIYDKTTEIKNIERFK